MAKNLDVSRYRNGDPIPQVQDSAEWANLTTGAWCYYSNNTVDSSEFNSDSPIYGKLYNWYALNDPRGLAPEGWHVPSDTEWTTLTDYLGGEDIAGGRLKSTSGWLDGYEDINDNGTNESGFSALPAGERYIFFTGYGYDTSLWCSTIKNGYVAWYWRIGGTENVIRYYRDLGDGLSVRCIKD